VTQVILSLIIAAWYRERARVRSKVWVDGTYARRGTIALRIQGYLEWGPLTPRGEWGFYVTPTHGASCVSCGRNIINP
jgi:hypothetical protein